MGEAPGAVQIAASQHHFEYVASENCFDDRIDRQEHHVLSVADAQGSSNKHREAGCHVKCPLP